MLKETELYMHVFLEHIESIQFKELVLQMKYLLHFSLSNVGSEVEKQ